MPANVGFWDDRTFEPPSRIDRFVPFFTVPRHRHPTYGDGLAYMNERPKLGSEQGGSNVHFWVFALI